MPVEVKVTVKVMKTAIKHGGASNHKDKFENVFTEKKGSVELDKKAEEEADEDVDMFQEVSSE